MKILQINQTYKIGSTGKIMSDISSVISNMGHESYMLCGYSNVKQDNLYIMSNIKYPWNARINILRMMITGINGEVYYNSTVKAMEWVDQISPDIIHLHNIHGDWINLKVLLDYIIAKRIPVVWTFHDCWAFTGRCSHFEFSKCEKWKSECGKCPNLKIYPTSLFLDFSKDMYRFKKDIFSRIKQLNIVTPSNWLATHVQSSFFFNRKVSVIHNGIDTLKYRIIKEKIIKKDNRRIILGVANSWSRKKGLIDFYALDKIIDHKKYVILLVGLNNRQLRDLPKSIIGIMRTNNEEELIRIYNQAFVFVNPTYEDNYPTTNLEAISCGTPVVTYKTGGSVECINSCTGLVVEQGNIQGIYAAIESLEKFDNNLCAQEAQIICDKNIYFKKYIELYEEIYKGIDSKSML